ncbi:MAG: hypothetical protein SGJ20_12820 [Planctomycetota bacterium]|nr:hypothetical protein [Planctomycetota bacterium]
MSAADLFEWITLLVSMPFAAALVFFRLVTALYVFIDAKDRSKNLWFALLLTGAVFFCYWPISFLAYLTCTALLDRKANASCAG